MACPRNRGRATRPPFAGAIAADRSAETGYSLSVSNHEAAQALKLIRALRDVLDELTAELARVERKAAMTRSKSMASAIGGRAECRRNLLGVGKPAGALAGI